MESAKITFGRRLRLVRKSRGLTLEELGKAASIGYKHIADIERGEKVPSFDAIDALAKALEVPPYELFLPIGDKQTKRDNSIGALTRELESRGSPGAKQLAAVILALLREIDRPHDRALTGQELMDQIIVGPTATILR